ncbi:MAG: O-antigen ligase family protein [Candidatus Sumerlaeota bacterium]
MELTEKKEPPALRRATFPAGLEVKLLIAFIVGLAFIGIFQIIKTDSMAILAIAAALCGVVLIWLGGTRACLPLYLATAFGDAMPLPGAPGISLNQCLALAVLAAFVVDVIRFKTKTRLRLSQNILIIFGIYVVTAAVLLKPAATEYPVQAPFYMFLGLIVTVLFWKPRWLNVLLGGIVVMAMLLLVIPGYLEFITGKDYMLSGKVRDSFRVNGLAKDSVVFAGVCVWTLFFAVYLAFSARLGIARVIFGVCIPLIVAVSLITFNRQTPIVITFCMLVMLFFMRSRYKYLVGGLILVAGLAAAPFFLPTIIERFGSAKSILTDYSLIEHHDKIEIAKEAFRRHPIFGIGHSAFKDTWTEYLPHGKIYSLYEYPHTRLTYVDMGYMQIAAEYGIVGATLVLAFFIAAAALFFRTYRTSLRLKDPLYANLLAMCAALFAQLLISLFVRDAFLTPQTYVMLGIFFASCTAVEEAAAREAEDVPADTKALPA